MGSVLIVGCGDIGVRVARLHRARDERVRGLARSASALERVAAAGAEPVRADLDAPGALRGLLAGAGLVYYLAPPPPRGTGDPRVDALVAAAADAPPERLVYISTSGVYGDRGGAWVTESDPIHPQTERARRRAAAEAALGGLGARAGTAVMILRVPGIYGPGRLPVERLRQGLPVLRDEDSPYTNRIHAHDLAAACLAAGERGRAGGIYNVSDGHPTTMTDYLCRVADLLGLPRPPAVDWEEAQRALSPSMLSFLRESRRLDNRRMRDGLGVRLRYPDLDAGLPACIEGRLR